MTQKVTLPDEAKEGQKCTVPECGGNLRLASG